MNCDICGKETKFLTVVDMRHGIDDKNAGEIMMREDCIRKHLCKDCSLELEDWFE